MSTRLDYPSVKIKYFHLQRLLLVFIRPALDFFDIIPKREAIS